MEFNWNEIVMVVVAFMFSWETISNIRYRRENKKLKQNEVKTSDVDTQKAQIELGDMFIKTSKDMFQQMQELQEQTLLATKKNGIDNEGIIKQLNEVITEQKRISEVQAQHGAELKRLADEQAKQAEEMKRLGEGQERLTEGQEHMVTFLNGKYQEFLEENGFKTVNKPVKKRSKTKPATAKK